MAVLAVIGAGRMGLPMAVRWMRAGHDVIAVDVDPERRRAADAAGLTSTSSAAEAIRPAQFVLTVLPGGPELRDLMLGPEGLVNRVRPEQIWIDMTSAGPDLGRDLAAAAAARGVAMLDAPLGGGVPAAENGTLTLYAGGAESTLAEARSVLEAVAGRILHQGAAGAGYLTKLLVNLLWFGQAVAVGEALLLAQAGGLELGRLREVLLEGPAGSEFVRTYLPALFAGDYLTTFGLDRVVEELESLRSLAAEHGLPFELSGLVADVHSRALAKFGPVDGELAGVSYLESEAGRLLRP